MALEKKNGTLLQTILVVPVIDRRNTFSLQYVCASIDDCTSTELTATDKRM